MLDTAAYLARIAYDGPTPPTADTLRDLHRAHLMRVPFENLDISLGREILCDEQAFLRKIVARRRGGFCYEMNGAFAVLLRTLGFKVTLLSARVSRGDGRFGPDFDHLALRVDLEQAWLADVGFGDSFVHPLRLQTGLEQEDRNGKYRIVAQDGGLCMQREQTDQTWKAEYLFALTPRRLQDFAGMCRHHQTSLDSPFTQKRICSMATPDGRVTLADLKLIRSAGGKRKERRLKTEEEWLRMLKKYFGVLL